MLKIKIDIPKTDAAQYNGLTARVAEIQEAELALPPGDNWTGYVVCRVEATEAGRTAVTHTPTAYLSITQIELMEGAAIPTARALFEAAYRERMTQNSLLDPEVTGDDGEEEGGPVTPAVARALRRGTALDHDRFEDPDADPRYAGRPISSVELPADEPGSPLPPREPGESDQDYAAAVDAMREAEQVGVEAALVAAGIPLHTAADDDPLDQSWEAVRGLPPKTARERAAAAWSPADDVREDVS